LRTLFDEYIFFLVDVKLSAVSSSPILPVSPHDNNFGVSHETSLHGPMEPFSLDNLLNKENPRLSTKHLPFPFQDTNHERIPQAEEDYLLQHSENILHLQHQYSAPRMTLSGMYPKTVDELRAQSTIELRLNSNLKRPIGGEPTLKPPTNTLGYTFNQQAESIRTQPSSHSLESLISTTRLYRENSPTESNKKMRGLDGQMAEVK